MKLYVSKCCSSPLLTRLGEEGTNFCTCQSCGLPCDPMVYPFTTVEQMTKWLKERKAYRGMANTSRPWSVDPKRSKEYTRYPPLWQIILLGLLMAGAWAMWTL